MVYLDSPKAAVSPKLLNLSYNHVTYNKLYDALVVKNSGRNKLISNISSKCISEGNGPLLIIVKKVGTSGGISHSNIIRDELLKINIDLPVVHGGLKKSEQTSIIEKLEKFEIPGAIVSEKIFGVGLSIKSLSYLILALAGSKDDQLIQRIGRMLRVYEGKPRPIIYDFNDTQSFFSNQSKSRMAAIERHYGNVIEEYT